MKNNGKSNKKSSGTRRKMRVGGDVPPRAVRTYHTASCLVPKVTEEALVRSTATTTITASATVSVKPTFNFTLAGAQVGSGFFDQYRIEAIRFTIAPQNNAVGLVTNSTTTLQPLYCVIDYDDSTALSSAGAAVVYSNCIVLNPGESCERVFQPRMAMAAYSGAFTSYAVMDPQWIDAASSSVQHYGIKCWVDPCTIGQTLLQSWDVTVEYFIRFRKSI